MDQDKFYTDEELASREEVAQPVQQDDREEVDDMEYFIELLKHLRLVVEQGGRVPLTSKVIIDADKCLMIIDDLERNLPDAVQYGIQMYSERTRILGDAEETAINRVTSAEVRANAALEKAKKKAEQLVVDAENEANAIVADAQERADHLVDDNEIVRQAREEARIIKNDARVEASELRLRASHEAYTLLNGIEEELAEACKTIRRLRTEVSEENE